MSYFQQDMHFGATSRHPVDGTAGLVLADSKTTLVTDFFHAARAIGSHAGHNDAHR